MSSSLTRTSRSTSNHDIQPYAGCDAASNAIGYAQQYSRAHDAVIRVYDDAGEVIQTYEHKGDFNEL